MKNLAVALCVVCLMATLISACGISANYGHDHLHRPINSNESKQEDGLVRPLKPLASLMNSNKRSYSWVYDTQVFTIELALEKRLNDDYEDLKKNFDLMKVLKDDDWSDYLQRLPGDTIVASIARQLTVMAELNNFNRRQLAELAITFVQSLPYDTDKAKELPLFINKAALCLYGTPYQVLYQGMDICVGKSILGFALLQELEFGSALIMMPNNKHAAFAISCESGRGMRDSLDYYYIESTDRMAIGAFPLIMDTKKVDQLRIALAKKGDIYYRKEL